MAGTSPIPRLVTITLSISPFSLLIVNDDAQNDYFVCRLMWLDEILEMTTESLNS